jgi:hypothetical protein
MPSNPVDVVDLVDIVDNHPRGERFLVLEVPDVFAVLALTVGPPASTAEFRFMRYGAKVARKCEGRVGLSRKSVDVPRGEQGQRLSFRG